MPLHSFAGVERVRVIDEDSPIVGRCGTVHRRLHASFEAWVRMDEEIPEELRRFPLDDKHGRGNDVVLFPDECEVAR
jgi:hypothetical protein